jgi:hypothetical protein
VLECSEDDLIKVCSVANRLLHHGAGPRAGGSMMIAKACALAAIYVREGAPRDLALFRRGKPSGTPISPSGGPGPEVQPAHPRGTGSGQDGKHHGRAIVSRDIML